MKGEWRVREIRERELSGHAGEMARPPLRQRLGRWQRGYSWGRREQDMVTLVTGALRRPSPEHFPGQL